jgi:hypothetical protein
MGLLAKTIGLKGRLNAFGLNVITENVSLYSGILSAVDGQKPYCHSTMKYDYDRLS